MNFKIKDLSAYEQLLKSIADLLELVKKVRERADGEKGVFAYINSFLFDTTMANCDLLRIKLQIDCTAKRIFIPAGKGCKLDAMIILPEQKDSGSQTERAKFSRLNLLDRKFQDQDQSSIISERSFGRDSFALELN